MNLITVIRSALDELKEFPDLTESDKGYIAGYIYKAIQLERDKILLKKDIPKLLKTAEGPLTWDCRGDDDEYAAMDNALTAFAKLKKYIKEV